MIPFQQLTGIPVIYMYMSEDIYVQCRAMT